MKWLSNLLERRRERQRKKIIMWLRMEGTLEAGSRLFGGVLFASKNTLYKRVSELIDMGLVESVGRGYYGHPAFRLVKTIEVKS